MALNKDILVTIQPGSTIIKAKKQFPLQFAGIKSSLSGGRLQHPTKSIINQSSVPDAIVFMNAY